MEEEQLVTITTKRVVKNTFFLIIGGIISKVFLLVLFAAAARFLGVEEFGKFTFALSFTAFITVIGDMGLNTLAVREVAKNRSLINKYLGGVFILRIILSLLVVGITFLFIALLKYPPDISKTVYLLGMYCFFYSLSMALRWCFQAFQKMEYETLMIVIEEVLILGIGLLVLYLGGGLMGLAWSYFFTYLFVFFFSLLIVIKKFGKPKIEIDFYFWKTLIKTAVPIGLTAVFFTLYSNFDTILLSTVKGNAAVGFYNAGYKLVNAIRFVPTMFFLAIFPVMSHFHIASIELLESILRKSLKYMFMFILPAAIGITVLSSKIIDLFFGKDFSPAASVLQILIWVIFLISIGRTGTYCLIAINKERIVTFIFAAALFINIVLNLVLIPSLSYIGAAVSVIITEIIIMFLAIYFVVRYIKISPFSFQIFKIIIVSLLMGFLTWLIKDLNIIFVILSSIIFYFFILLLTKTISREDKLFLKQIFSR